MKSQSTHRMLRPLLGSAAALLLASCATSDRLPYQSTFRIEPGDDSLAVVRKAAHTVPSANQLAALEREYIAFVHFGPNTFTRKEWGNGMEDPRVFDLRSLDTDQWCEAMKAAGMKMVIITAKHHDGFVLWQSRYTTHGVMSSPYKDGKGDIVKELSRSCQKYGLKLGIYLSPADLYQIESPQGLYGNLSQKTRRVIPREVPGRPFANQTKFEFVVDDYNEYYLNQLFELLTEYGPIHEVWLDGAHPKRKGGQTYDYQAWKKLIHTLAPEAVVFGREDVRWCGNEAGRTRDVERNVIAYPADPDTMNHFADMMDYDLSSIGKLRRAPYIHYQQAETNTSIREGWFYRDDTGQQVRSADDVFDIYERAVGGNSIFLLNIPPNREGRFSPADVESLREAGRRIRETYGTDLLDGASGPKALLDDKADTYVTLKGKRRTLTISTPEPITLNRLTLQEAIAQRGGYNTDVFPNAQMYYPAAGVMLAQPRLGPLLPAASATPRCPPGPRRPRAYRPDAAELPLESQRAGRCGQPQRWLPDSLHHRRERADRVLAPLRQTARPQPRHAEGRRLPVRTGRSHRAGAHRSAQTGLASGPGQR